MLEWTRMMYWRAFYSVVATLDNTIGISEASAFGCFFVGCITATLATLSVIVWCLP